MIRAVFDIVQKKKSGRIITGMLFLVATALPSLIPAFHSFLAPAAGGIDLHLWRQLARFRMNHGYFISAWVPDRFIQIAGCYLAIFFAFRKHPAFNRLLPIMLGVAGGLALAAIGDCFTIRFFLRLQPGRCSYFIYFLVAAFAAGAMADRVLWDNGKKVRYAWNFAALIGLVMVGNAALSGQPHMTKTIITALLIVAGWPGYRRGFSVTVHPGFLFACLAAIVLTSTVPRSSSLFNWTMAQSLSDPWVDVGLWCRKSIPKDETVMVPLDKENFRPMGAPGNLLLVEGRRAAPFLRQHPFCVVAPYAAIRGDPFVKDGPNSRIFIVPAPSTWHAPTGSAMSSSKSILCMRPVPWPMKTTATG